MDGDQTADRRSRQLLLLIEGASVVTMIDGDDQGGADARHAAEQLVTVALDTD